MDQDGTKRQITSDFVASQVHTHDNRWWDPSRVSPESSQTDEESWISCEADDPDGIYFWQCDGIVDWDGDLIVTTLMTMALGNLIETMTQWEMLQVIHEGLMPETDD